MYVKRRNFRRFLCLQVSRSSRTKEAAVSRRMENMRARGAVRYRGASCPAVRRGMPGGEHRAVTDDGDDACMAFPLQRVRQSDTGYTAFRHRWNAPVSSAPREYAAGRGMCTAADTVCILRGQYRMPATGKQKSFSHREKLFCRFSPQPVRP